MELVKWSNFFSVDIPEIDEQHKKLVDLLNNLFNAMINGKGLSNVEEVLKELMDYSVFHFKTEEKLFENYLYPNKDEHLEEHKIFVEKVTGFLDQIKENQKTVTSDVLSFMQSWLKEHILQEDKKYGKFFKDKGILIR